MSAACDAPGTASVALLRRVGMWHQATHRRSAWWKGEWPDEEVYAVLAEVWSAEGRPGTGTRTGEHNNG